MLLNLNHNIITMHGYGMLDLNEYMLQARDTVSNVTYLFPNVNKMNVLKGLLASKRFKPLYDRSVKLYTNGLSAFSNNYVTDNYESLKLENEIDIQAKYFNIDAKVFDDCMKYITAVIWYRGITQEELFRYIDLDKVFDIVNLHGFKYKFIDPLKSESLLQKVLYDGVKLSEVSSYKEEEVKRVIDEYYASNGLRTLITMFYNLENGLIDILFYDYIDKLPILKYLIREYYIHSEKDIDALDFKKVDLVIFNGHTNESTLKKDLYSIIETTKKYKIPLFIKDDFVQTVLTLINENKENIKSEYICLSNLGRY